MVDGANYGYKYDQIDGHTYWDGLTRLYVPIDKYTIFGRILQSRSKALGAAMPSNFTSATNLTKYNFDKEHYSHSRQFRSYVTNEINYWSNIVKDMELNSYITNK